jgi:hypothetical protein
MALPSCRHPATQGKVTAARRRRATRQWTGTLRRRSDAEQRAARWSVLARRQAARGEIESLRAELALLDGRGALIPWQIDKAQRRVDHSERQVELIESATRDLRRRAAVQSVQRVRAQARAAAERSAVLSDVATETEAGQPGPDGNATAGPLVTITQ